MSPDEGTVEVVRGRITDALAGEILGFWAREGALDETAGRRRLPDVVCVLRDGAGQIAGVNSVYRAELEGISGREFWVYRSFLAPAAAGSWAAMVSGAYRALDAEFDPARPGPIGLALLLDDPAERGPEAEWAWPRALYAGHLGDGRQLRIRYFSGARVGTPRPVVDFGMVLDRNYRIEPFAEQDAVAGDAVVDLWTREAGIPPDEARRRLEELLLVATVGGGEPVAVSTAYLEHNEQLGLDMWYFRAFVAPAHRATRVGWSLMVVGRDRLKARYVGGQDTRGHGIVLEVENEMLKQYFDHGLWYPADFTFIGENERGDHVRVHFFPGALAPSR